jgi:hypothetical protein
MTGDTMPPQKRTWLSLLTFCLFRVLGVALAASALLIGGTLTFAGDQTPIAVIAADQTPTFVNTSLSTADVPREDTSGANQAFSGMVTESECGARHDRQAGMSSSECVRSCVRHGAKYTLVDGDKQYMLSGNVGALGKVAGQRVKVIGTQEADEIRVASISEE